MLNPKNGGFPRAQSVLGLLYYFGEGVNQNYHKAFELFEKAAEKRNRDACNGLGFCYKYGRGIQQNYKEAIKWFKEAINLLYFYAMYNLGESYFFGKGVDLDYAEAAKWFEKSANECPFSNLALGYLAEKGLAMDVIDHDASYYYDAFDRSGAIIENESNVDMLSSFAKDGCSKAISLINDAAKRGIKSAEEVLMEIRSI